MYASNAHILWNAVSHNLKKLLGKWYVTIIVHPHLHNHEKPHQVNQHFLLFPSTLQLQRASRDTKSWTHYTTDMCICVYTHNTHYVPIHNTTHMHTSYTFTVGKIKSNGDAFLLHGEWAYERLTAIGTPLLPCTMHLDLTLSHHTTKKIPTT